MNKQSLIALATGLAMGIIGFTANADQASSSSLNSPQTTMDKPANNLNDMSNAGLANTHVNDNQKLNAGNSPMTSDSMQHHAAVNPSQSPVVNNQ